MAAQPARPWFRLSSLARPAGPDPIPVPAPPPAPMAPPPPAPLVQPTLRPLAPPPAAEPNPPPAAPRAPTPPPSPAPSSYVPQPAPTPQVVAAPAPPPPSPPAATRTNASLPSSPARGINSAPSAASPPATAIAITSSTASSAPPSPANRLTTSQPNSPATRAGPQPPPQHSPPKPTATAYIVPQQNYSPPKPTSTTIQSASAAREPSPSYNPSPRTIKPVNNTPPQSPNRLKPTAPPPSPLNLPPSMLRSSNADQRVPLEAEQKTVLFQKTIDQNKPDSNIESHKPNHHGGIHGHHAKHEEKFHRKKSSSDSSEEGLGKSVITLAGENKGAYMELIRSPGKHHAQQHGHNSHFLRNNDQHGQTIGSHQSNKSSSSSSTSSEDEGKPKMKVLGQRGGHNAGSSLHSPLSSYTNSNVQGINNSIMYNSSCTHHDPGVHLALTRKPNGDGFHVKNHVHGRHS